jgi:hypothetical protein
MSCQISLESIHAAQTERLFASARASYAVYLIMHENPTYYTHTIFSFAAESHSNQFSGRYVWHGNPYQACLPCHPSKSYVSSPATFASPAFLFAFLFSVKHACAWWRRFTNGASTYCLGMIHLHCSAVNKPTVRQRCIQ